MPSLITQGFIDSRFTASVSGYNFAVTASGTDYTVTATPTSTNLADMVITVCRMQLFVIRRRRAERVILASRPTRLVLLLGRQA